MFTDGVVIGVTFICTSLEVTVAGLAQGAFEVNTQLTTSPLSGA